MIACSTTHPDHPDLACVLPRTEKGHPHHLAQRYVEGRSEPEQIDWIDPDYVSPQSMREQGRKVSSTIETHASNVRRQIRESEPQVKLGLSPNQRKKTRLGQVANLLVNNVGVWIDGHRLEPQEIGGSSGLRRLRELRDDYHWNIEQRPTDHSTDQYRLVELPTEFED